MRAMLDLRGSTVLPGANVKPDELRRMGEKNIQAKRNKNRACRVTEFNNKW